MDDPQPDFRPPIGVAEPLAPGLRRILAPNPSPMTFRGTNTYLLGNTELAVIDPGPADDAHLEAILAALRPGQRISHILVTHAHRDHSGLAPALAACCGAPVLGYGPAGSGRSAVMQALAETGAVSGGEGVDTAYEPSHILADGAIVEGAGWRIEALHLPGHMADHLGFAWHGMLFSGDLVMGWASSLISPPDGDLTAFMASLARLQARDWTAFHPGHGAPVADPAARVEALVAHRRTRSDAILSALADGAADAETLARRVYTDLAPALLPAAVRNVLAHLIALQGTGQVTCALPLRADSRFTLAQLRDLGAR
jgi:glyoxylase-like metal-dependent hydrolase (beta-lactamase superfamily II)